MIASVSHTRQVPISPIVKSNDPDLVHAVYDQTLWTVAQSLGTADGDAIAATCQRIFDASDAEANRLADLVPDIDVQTSTAPSGQLHSISAIANTPTDAKRFVDAAVADGYVRWQDFGEAGDEVFFRTATSTNLVRLDGVPFTLQVGWSVSSLAEKLPNALVPSGLDLGAAELPKAAWPAYFAVRPLRLLRDRISGVKVESNILGPILSTPSSLIGPLLEHAQVTADDHLFDLGCGEGRVVIEAAQAIGCRSTGIERDLALVHRARSRLSNELPAANNVEIIHGDALEVDLGSMTVAFMFVPAEVVGDVSHELRQRGFEGRIVSHEQQAPPGHHQLASSTLLVSDDAVTVAHNW